MEWKFQCLQRYKSHCIYLKVGTTVVVHGQCFSCTLALIVAAPDTCCEEKHIYTSVKPLWSKYTFHMCK